MENNLKIIPLGGFDKIGMNMTVIEYADSIIVIDCGTSFPPNNMPGIDTVIPDIDYLVKNADKVKGIVLTHGHEDHIGAIPYILSDLNVPIYGTPLTIALVEKKLALKGIKKARTKVIKIGNTIVLGAFKIEFVRANHSIPDAAMLAIYTPVGIVFHTGDFKIDLTPIMGDAIDIPRLSTIGTKGVLALLSDSTNALREGLSPSEADVNNQLDILFNRHRNKRLIVATFASNMDRVQQIILLAEKYNKKVILEGEVMLSIFSASEKLGYLKIPGDVLIDIADMDKYEDKDIIFLTTGNHGEPIKCLMNIASGNHPLIRIRKDDVVLFSSIAIQGSESEFSKTLNILEEQGAEIVFQDIHATGHACAGELLLLYSLLKPKYLIPAHGEYRYRRAAAGIGESTGIPRDNIWLIKNGDILELTEDSCRLAGTIPLKEICIDGLIVDDMDKNLIEERRILSESGIVIAELCFEKKSGRLVAAPRITTRGFTEGFGNDSIIETLHSVLNGELSRLITQDVRDDRLEAQLKAALSKCVYDNTGQSPMIVVLITNAVL